MSKRWWHNQEKVGGKRRSSQSSRRARPFSLGIRRILNISNHLCPRIASELHSSACSVHQSEATYVFFSQATSFIDCNTSHLLLRSQMSGGTCNSERGQPSQSHATNQSLINWNYVSIAVIPKIPKNYNIC